MKRIKDILFAIFFGFVVAYIVYIASQTVLYWPFLKIQNAIDDSHFIRRFMLSGTDWNHTDNIIIVDYDDSTIDTLGNFKSKWWPPDYLAKVIGNLKNDGARLIFLDAMLEEHNRYNDNLADSMKAAGNVIAGYYFKLDEKSKTRRPLDPVINERFSKNWLKKQSPEKNELIKAQKIVLPYYKFIMSAKSLGYTNYVPDPDGILRHIPLIIVHRGKLFTSIPLQIWLDLNGLENSHVTISPSGIRYGDRFIPTDKHCFMRLNFAASKPIYPNISFVDVYNGTFEQGKFRNKIVMIGSSSKKLGDLKRIPGYSSLPGVEIHATALSTLLNQKYLEIFSGNVIFVITILCGILSSVLFNFLPPIRVGFPVAICVPLSLYIYAIYAFIVHSKLINISIPSFVILLLYCVIVIHRFMEQYERNNLH